MKKRTYVAGHNGMLGSAIVRLFEQKELGDCVNQKQFGRLEASIGRRVFLQTE